MIRKVLVTGGAGYIGSHACKLLKEKGYEPIVFDNFSRGWKEAVKYGAFVEGDLRSEEDLRNLFSKHTFEAVMHFAALAYVGESMSEPDLYWNNNVVGSINLLNCVADYGIDKFIFSSTCSMYGDSEGELITEDTKLNPLNTYAKTKLTVENVLYDYSEKFQIKSCIFRYFNVAGSDPDLEVGEKHIPETHLIPLVITAALTGEEIKVFGDDFQTNDGTCVRDYVHVVDLVEAHIRGLESLDSDYKRPCVFNLGTGVGYSVLDIIKQVERVTGKKVFYKIESRRQGDGAFLVSDNRKAVEQLGWSLDYSNLDSIISTNLAWQTNGGY